LKGLRPFKLPLINGLVFISSKTKKSGVKLAPDILAWLSIICKDSSPALVVGK
jgi:hypothetical protein